MTNDNLAFAEELHAAIDATGLSQRAVAEELGIPLRTVEAWLGGTRVPPAYTQAAVLARVRKLAVIDD